MKFPSLGAVVKAALAVSHGQGDVERGLSSSGRTLTEDSASMSERTLNAYMVVKSAMSSCFNNQPALVPMTKEILTYAEAASSKYKQYLEDARRKKDEELKKLKEEELNAEKERRKKIAENEKDSMTAAQAELNDLKKTYACKRKQRESILEEANKRLKAAVRKTDMK